LTLLPHYLLPLDIAIIDYAIDIEILTLPLLMITPAIDITPLTLIIDIIFSLLTLILRH
jgi:hypothetical protein